MSIPIITADGSAVNLAATTVDGETYIHYILHVDGSEASIENPVATVGHRGYIPTVTKVTASTDAVELLAENEQRHTWSVYNDSTATLYLKLGVDAGLDDWSVKVPADSYFESPSPIYAGAVSGIWSSVNGQARITEVE